MQDLQELIKLIDDAIKEDASPLITEGNIIKDGYDEEVDELRNIIKNSKDWLSAYQKKLINDSQINALKIKYTNISGYFIEIPNSQISKIPSYFVHKQTLVSATRFITKELKDFEKKLFEGEGILAQKEYEIFLKIREHILDNYKEIKKKGENIAFIDFIASLSQVASENNYTKPHIHEGYNLEIKGGRHPVIEKFESDFISNDLLLKEEEFVHILTGPNMGGKSTFLRQNALIILLAHMGSFVPAKTASIPLTDKIFSRIGASDNLALGQSTFMVEMQEVANILNNSTKKSFVIIDEIGRGTSTYDGMSLAWAILKYNHDSIGAKTLFATHYHELVDESKILSGVKNFSIAVGENDENLIFLRKIIPGGIKKSYGIEVARIAGIGNEIILEARKMLKKLELEHKGDKISQLSFGDFGYKPEIQIIEKESEVEEEIKNIDINNITPIDALVILQSLKKKVRE
ncbi:DNA mismatch repair protein MutS [Candidatus Gracilibacteria bacterium]|nr:DNA mismatch repair protein MutS [Candidatus Gracilibacteria bacterium]NUJ99067.1 DNA mismatch repair protein MutS [Candidatus Gracilibacteria bacterium]